MISQLLSKSKWKEHSQCSHVALIWILILLLLAGENYLTILPFSHVICENEDSKLP